MCIALFPALNNKILSLRVPNCNEAVTGAVLHIGDILVLKLNFQDGAHFQTRTGRSEILYIAYFIAVPLRLRMTSNVYLVVIY